MWAYKVTDLLSCLYESLIINQCPFIQDLQQDSKNNHTTTALTPSSTSSRKGSSNSTKINKQTRRSSSVLLENCITRWGTWRRISTYNPRARNQSMSSSSSCRTIKKIYPSLTIYRSKRNNFLNNFQRYNLKHLFKMYQTKGRKAPTGYKDKNNQ